ncbi:hypothetical protein SLEP1_g25105 [Rubroshorea leprosula]|uniref:Uncharacterized protein n=1 Tax=Rubroshorea leprosula TaxID=152421 RepID=A0AAV5JTD8_9ROSI|nr:hypothetical protein SLEP1_g25105 [Rubroshorea leprosula]
MWIPRQTSASQFSAGKMKKVTLVVVGGEQAGQCS